MLRLYNTLTRSKETFIPLDQNHIGMYVCGPTVYDAPHLGNALSIVVYDCLYRLLRHLYGPQNITYVRNITDVDDKINKAAKDKSISIDRLTQEITINFHQDLKLLNCLTPNYEPRATLHIKEMISMIEKLINSKHAYIRNDHVYFAVMTDPDYGKISSRSIDDLIHGVRIAIDQHKTHPEDFVLWKPADPEDDISSIFDSPWGKGRPGWHIECSAMSNKYLGHDFDIHGGGVDLLFPHHTNEIAQSCCAFPGSKYARFWVHNGFLTVNGEKMSKSLGNFITLRELLDNNIPGELIRYVFMSSHYRKPSDWSDKDMRDAQVALDNFYDLILESDLEQEACTTIPDEFLECLTDDLNTPMAYAFLHELATKARSEIDKVQQKALVLALKSSANLLGMLQMDPKQWFQRGLSAEEKHFIEDLIKQRLDAKQNKNYDLADKIRSELMERGIIIEDQDMNNTIWKIRGLK
jgi:cysteinyl-tRNA synthetase